MRWRSCPSRRRGTKGPKIFHTAEFLLSKIKMHPVIPDSIQKNSIQSFHPVIPSSHLWSFMFKKLKNCSTMKKLTVRPCSTSQNHCEIRPKVQVVHNDILGHLHFPTKLLPFSGQDYVSKIGSWDQFLDMSTKPFILGSVETCDEDPYSLFLAAGKIHRIHASTSSRRNISMKLCGVYQHMEHHRC